MKDRAIYTKCTGLIPMDSEVGYDRSIENRLLQFVSLPWENPVLPIPGANHLLLLQLDTRDKYDSLYKAIADARFTEDMPAAVKLCFINYRSYANWTVNRVKRQFFILWCAWLMCGPFVEKIGIFLNFSSSWHLKTGVNMLQSPFQKMFWIFNFH